MRVAITGYKGRLGSELVRHGGVPLDCDISDMSSIKKAIAKINPYIIINCAAFTNVDACEDQKTYLEKALPVNYFGVKLLRLSFSGLIIHISTDYIFKGNRGPYSETILIDKPSKAPVNAYGLTKLGGELVLRAYPELPFCIVRTTCLYENHIRNDFVSKCLSALEQGENFEATTRLSGNPTYVPHLVNGLSRLTSFYARDSSKFPHTVHISGKECLSRYEFALMIANVFGYDPKMIIPSRKKFWVGERPSKGGFKTSFAERIGIPIYSVIDGLNAYKQNQTKQL